VIKFSGHKNKTLSLNRLLVDSPMRKRLLPLHRPGDRN
jgi:hypothetical protein